MRARLKNILSPSFKDFKKPTQPMVVVSTDSDFCREAVRRGCLTEEQMAHAAERYRLGRSRSGKCIFWMIDELGIVRDGHIGDAWASQMLKAREPEVLRFWHAEHCLFGLHLLCHTEIDFNVTQKALKALKYLGHTDDTDDTDFLNVTQKSRKSQKYITHTDTDSTVVLSSSKFKQKLNLKSDFLVTNMPVCVVEKEASAVILSEWFPECIWMAFVYSSNFSVCSFEPLQGCEVVLYPSTDETMSTYLSWLDLADQVRREYQLSISVSDVLEQHATPEQKAAHIDLVDFLFDPP